ncbi:MAG: hypothetical protein MUF18_18290 [Fimbriiglobus sp.]|jgi:hypothetical protein|nr:hypothetical protein [Fimbriiglobus sp.]
MKIALRALRLLRTPLNCVAVLLAAAFSNAQDLPLDQTVKEIRAAQEALRLAETQLKTWKCTADSTRGGRANTGPVAFTIKRHQNCELGIAKQGRMVKNDSEVFAIEQIPISNFWVVNTYQKSNLDIQWKSMNRDRSFVFYPLQAVEDQWTCLDVMNDSTFTAKQARKVGDNRVELDYEYDRPADARATARGRRTGTLTFATDLDWAIVRSVAQTQPIPTVGATDIDLGTIDSTMIRNVIKSGQTLIVDSITFDYKFSKTSQFNCKNTYTFIFDESIPVDPSEFTLAHYGVQAPQYEVYEDRPMLNWLVWGIVGLAFLAVSIFFAWLVRRRRISTRG